MDFCIFSLGSFATEHDCVQGVTQQGKFSRTALVRRTGKRPLEDVETLTHTPASFGRRAKRTPRDSLSAVGFPRRNDGNCHVTIGRSNMLDRQVDVKHYSMRCRQGNSLDIETPAVELSGPGIGRGTERERSGAEFPVGVGEGGGVPTPQSRRPRLALMMFPCFWFVIQK
jgi:hypothetical protein